MNGPTVRSTLTYDSRARLVLFGTIATVIALGVNLALWLSEGIFAARSEIATMRLAIEKAAATPEFPVVDTARFLEARTPTEASAAMQAHVTRIAAEFGLTVDTMQIADPVKRGTLSEIGVRINGALPETALPTLIARFATGAPLVTVDGFSAQAIPPVMVAEGQAAPPRALAVQLEVTGFARIGSP